ncbi:helix-hairpin-helix domain-containing protein [Qipengyuania sp. DGS5-3]|uniref:helix-hairpin-helix domain-containing protein n=1 Tax=Qipengyuania sp. DGS5-3 TaxID=3349632 RepID=UPI0036D3B54E
MTMEFIEANWPLVAMLVLLVLLVGWYLFHASRRTTVSSDKSDVLDEGAAPAARNQALIDSAPSATKTMGAPIAEPAAAPEAAPEAAAAPGAPPVPAPAPAQVAAGSDDLTRIKGVGPKLAKMLSELGVTSFAQIAAWDAAEIARLDAQLGRFQGRIERDNWTTQAKFLAAGDLDGYAAQFGAID